MKKGSQSGIEKKTRVRLIGQERQPMRSASKRALMNEFSTVKKFLVSTEIRLKRFDKRSFKSGEMERSTSSGKDMNKIWGHCIGWHRKGFPKDALQF